MKIIKSISFQKVQNILESISNSDEFKDVEKHHTTQFIMNVIYSYRNSIAFDEKENIKVIIKDCFKEYQEFAKQF